MVGHRKTANTNPEELAELMVGRKVLLRVDRGLSSRYRAVQGLDREDPRREQKLGMLAGVFRESRAAHEQLRRSDERAAS